MPLGTPFLLVFYYSRTELWFGQQGASVRGNISESVVGSSLEELSIQHHCVAAPPQQAGRISDKSHTAITHRKEDKRKLAQNKVWQDSRAKIKAVCSIKSSSFSNHALSA